MGLMDKYATLTLREISIFGRKILKSIAIVSCSWTEGDICSDGGQLSFSIVILSKGEEERGPSICFVR